MDLVVSDSLHFYWKRVAAKSDTLYTMEIKKFEQLNRINESLQIALKEEKRKRQKISIGVGVGALSGILMGVLLGK